MNKLMIFHDKVSRDKWISDIVIKAHNIMCVDAPFSGATNVLCAINEQISDIMEIVMQEHKCMTTENVYYLQTYANFHAITMIELYWGDLPTCPVIEQYWGYAEDGKKWKPHNKIETLKHFAEFKRITVDY